MGNEIEITTKNWYGEKKLKFDSGKIINAYAEMRMEIIRKCPLCKKPKDEYDSGSFCEEHKKYEDLENMISEIFLS